MWIAGGRDGSGRRYGTPRGGEANKCPMKRGISMDHAEASRRQEVMIEAARTQMSQDAALARRAGAYATVL